MIQVERTALPEVLLITPRRFVDARGWFCETWNTRALAAAGLDWPDFVQDNHSHSTRRHTLRGLHFQHPPHAQDKLVRCTRGAIRDVVVDIRAGAPSYGTWIRVELSAENGTQLFVPKGFAHGVLTLTDTCEVQYKCTDHYAPSFEAAILWNSLGIDWGVADPILSGKDASAPPFSQLETPFRFESLP